VQGLGFETGAARVAQVDVLGGVSGTDRELDLDLVAGFQPLTVGEGSEDPALAVVEAAEIGALNGEKIAARFLGQPFG